MAGEDFDEDALDQLFQPSAAADLPLEQMSKAQLLKLVADSNKLLEAQEEAIEACSKKEVELQE